MKKSELKALIQKNFKRSFEANSPDMIRALDKKQLKEYINTHGGFSKGKIVKMNTIEKAPKIDGVPEDAIYIEAELSDESENMNGYVIESDAWLKLLPAFFSDFGGFVLYQHTMSNPIGKTLTIEQREENGRKYLRASAYVWDEYTEKKLSRGLVSDISTGHIPLLIIYRNRTTNEEMSYEDFWIMIDEMVDKMIEESKTRTEIRTAITDKIAEYQERHREVQLVEWSAVTIGSNKQAEIKTIKNKLEVINNEIPEEDLEKPVENDVEEDAPIETPTDPIPAKEDDDKEETTPAEGEQPNPTTENDLEIEGGTPEGSQDKPTEPEKTLTVEEQNSLLIAENEQLKAANKVKDEEITKLNAKIDTLTNDVKEITELNASRKKVVLNVPLSLDDEMKNAVDRQLNLFYSFIRN